MLALSSRFLPLACLVLPLVACSAPSTSDRSTTGDGPDLGPAFASLATEDTLVVDEAPTGMMLCAQRVQYRVDFARSALHAHRENVCHAPPGRASALDAGPDGGSGALDGGPATDIEIPLDGDDTAALLALGRALRTVPPTACVDSPTFTVTLERAGAPAESHIVVGACGNLSAASRGPDVARPGFFELQSRLEGLTGIYPDPWTP